MEFHFFFKDSLPLIQIPNKAANPAKAASKVLFMKSVSENHKYISVTKYTTGKIAPK
ncbi:hypothetical protein HMPREF0083_01134 [Aneurinibacillus aneurinilyticus ATCC 12856]|uniref:Uncharacterized protein n=1 Tax=Aneurinibacillus aneurinilyticus ATCC 12856 TaxID=649747 RepID=U1YFC2_ANEAE|nr:hypothetical protein HMPREF0083_01134 [Aneurinibacillus aneurinilyticus ATCC 12856]